MAKLLLFTALFAFAAIATATSSKLDAVHTLWSTWKTQHGKSYAASEELMRFGIFVQNLEKIAKMNAESTTTHFAINKFADLTLTEFQHYYTKNMHEEQPSEFAEINPADILPGEVDWRKKGAITPIKDQGKCGSCWSFAAAAVLEGYHYIRSGELINLSEQELVDCSTSYGNNGCNGGLASQAYSYVRDHGLTTLDEYPYTALDGTCKSGTRRAVSINGWANILPNNSLAVKGALIFGPVSISVEVNDTFRFYKSGVLSADCGVALNHAIILVGYKTTDDGEGFIARNSWGTGWGEEGYLRLSTRQDINDGQGICGMFIRPTTVF